MSARASMEGVNVWFITGTSSGFGRRLVDAVLARGDCVIATARSMDKIADFPKSSNLKLMQLDVTDSVEHIKSKANEAANIWGRIDVLVNNAAYSEKALIEEATSDLFRKQFETNVFGLIDVTTAILPHMRARKSGTVVLIGSRSSWKPENPSGGLYAASKAVIRTFGETLAVEVAEFSIRVLIVEPGLFRTEGIFSYPFYEGNPIADYDALRKKSKALYAAVEGKQKGDPVKAMKALVDVVRDEGKAKGKDWPLYLPLGEEAEMSIREKCKKMSDVMDEWEDIIQDMNFDE